MALQNPQIDYSVKTAPIIPRYKYSRLFQQVGGDSATITTSPHEVVFELPPKCLNLSRSYLSFTSTPGTAGTKAFFVDTPAFLRQVDLYTRGGVFLCSINNFDKYANIVLKAETPIEEAEVTDKSTEATAVTHIGAIRGSSDNVRPAAVNANTNSNDNVYEPIYLKQATGATATPILNIQFPMSHIKNTILAMDKDFFFNDSLLIRFTFNPYTSWGYLVNGDPGLPIAENIAVSKLYFYVALETNQEISNALMATVQSAGLTTIVPYVYQYKNNPSPTGTSTAQNVTIRLNSSHGRHIKRIYHTLFNTAEELKTRYLHSNLARDIVTSYYTAINGHRLNEFDIRPGENEDWLVHKDILKGTILGSTHETYLYNWVAIDKFDDELLSNKSDTVDSGLPLGSEVRWDFMGTTSADNHNHYTFVIVTRQLAITNSGIFIQ